MSFIWPAMLLTLLLIPLCVVWYVRLQRRRQRLLARYGSFGLSQGAQGRQLGLRRHIPRSLFLAGLAILLIALDRPAGGVLRRFGAAFGRLGRGAAVEDPATRPDRRQRLVPYAAMIALGAVTTLCWVHLTPGQ